MIDAVFGRRRRINCLASAVEMLAAVQCPIVFGTLSCQPRYSVVHRLRDGFQQDLNLVGDAAPGFLRKRGAADFAFNVWRHEYLDQRKTLPAGDYRPMECVSRDHALAEAQGTSSLQRPHAIT